MLPPLWDDSFSDRYEVKLFRPHANIPYWSVSISSPDNTINFSITGNSPREALILLMDSLEESGIDLE